MNEMITSLANPRVKWLRSLHKNSTRREEGVFLVEGAKEISFALDGGFEPHAMFVCPEIAGANGLLQESLSDAGELSNFYTVSQAVFAKVAYRENSDGLLAVFKAKSRILETLNFGDHPFLIVVEAVEKPGNLGAIIRTADGCGADGVIVCDERTDIFNPNVIRSSVGTVFTKQVVAASSEQVADFLDKHEITAYGAILSSESSLFTKVDFARPSAILLGTEHEGLSDFWKARCQPIIIPMQGKNDSLNVSNAAAVLGYEVLRQRQTSDQ